MPEPTPSDPPVSRAWQIWSAVIVLAFLTAIWWFIEWRSAPPPPPPPPLPQPATPAVEKR